MGVRAFQGDTIGFLVNFGPTRTGQVGTVTYKFVDTTGATVVAASTASVAEIAPGQYIVPKVMTGPVGTGFVGAIVWNSPTPSSLSVSEDVVVTASSGIAGGTSLVTITTEAPAASPQAGTFVTILSGNTVITSGVTDGNGKFFVGLPNGSYTVKAIKPGVATFSDTPFTVASANVSFTMIGTLIVIPPPASPLLVTIFGDINDLTLGLVDINEVILNFHIAKPPQVGSDRIITLHTFSLSTADGTIDPLSGHFQIDVARGVLVRVESTELGLSQVFKAPDQPTVNLKSLIVVGLLDAPGLLPPI